MGHVIILIVAGLVVFHLLGGLFHHANHHRRGRRVNIGWSLRRGWWGGFRFLGGTYYHRL